jgi:hypothetical protein
MGTLRATDWKTAAIHVLRDDRLDLVTLGRLARTFDQISSEDGQLYRATDFVRWLADEWRASQPDKAEREAA